MKAYEGVKNECCICKIKITGYGHNPYPIKNKGVCCDNCNKLVVLFRLSTYGMNLIETETNEKK